MRKASKKVARRPDPFAAMIKEADAKIKSVAVLVKVLADEMEAIHGVKFRYSVCHEHECIMVAPVPRAWG